MSRPTGMHRKCYECNNKWFSNFKDARLLSDKIKKPVYYDRCYSSKKQVYPYAIIDS